MTDTIDRSHCPGRRHGTNSAYRNAGCRCPDARELYRVYEKRRREKRLAPAMMCAVGTARRLQALAALGWSINHLAHRLHVSPQRVNELRVARWAAVHRDTAAAVLALYEQLSGTRGPSAITRAAARRNQWPPPLLWDGIDIDHPAATPAADPRRPRKLELAEVDHLAAFGLTLPAIADRLGVAAASIERARQRAARAVRDRDEDAA